jgi:hypothetical protein
VWGNTFHTRTQLLAGDKHSIPALKIDILWDMIDSIPTQFQESIDFYPRNSSKNIGSRIPPSHSASCIFALLEDSSSQLMEISQRPWPWRFTSGYASTVLPFEDGLAETNRELKRRNTLHLFIFRFNILFFFLTGPPQSLGLRFSSGPHRRQGRD